MRLVENTIVTMKDAVGVGLLTTAANGVNMAKYNRCRIILLVTTSNSAPSGGLVSLYQGTSATCSTALAIPEYWYCGDMLAGDTLTHVGNYDGAVDYTATQMAVQNKTAMYVFEIKSSQLSSATWGSEDIYIRLGQTAVTVATSTMSVIYELYEPRVARGAEGMPTAY